MRWFRRWRLMRAGRHSHETFVHSHCDPSVYHAHVFDECCRRAECREFPIHRVHPRAI